MSTTTTHKTLVSNFFTALNNGDIDAVVDSYADDGYVQTMGNTLISGKSDKQKIAASIRGIFDVFPSGLTFTVRDMVAEGDKVAVEAQSDGEHISGQNYSNEYHFLFEFRNEKLVRLKEYMDTEIVTDILCRGQRPPFGT